MKILKAILLLLSATLPALAMENRYGFCEKGGIKAANVTTQGSYPSCQVTVYLTGTLTKATIYSDNMSTPLSNPFTATVFGFWQFYAADGHYDVQTQATGLSLTYGDLELLSSVSGGGVTSVGLSLPASFFTVTISPITTTGTLTAVLLAQAANCIWAGPASGSAAAPTCRALVAADMPAVAVLTNQANTYSTGLQDFGAATMKIAHSPGYSPTVSATIGYDDTSNVYRFGVNGTAKIIGMLTGAFTDGHCIGYQASTLSLVDAGAPCGSGGGGSVFQGSTALAPAFSATPTFSLANVSAQSPVRFEPGPLTANVTGVTFTNLTAGAKFSIVWTQDGTGGRTVTYGSAINTCQVSPTAGIATTQEFEVSQSGVTVFGTFCSSNDAWHGVSAPEGTAPAGIGGTDLLYADSTAHRFKMNNNNGTAAQVVASGVDINTLDQVTITHLAAALPTNQGGIATTAPAFTALTDGATVTWAIGSALIANADLTFTVHSGSRTLNITGPVSGGVYTLWIKQDGTGGEGLTLGTGCTWKVAGGGSGAITPSTGAGAIDLLYFTFDGTSCFLNFVKNYS